jgi:NitT/TauT family transport system permease protein
MRANLRSLAGVLVFLLLWEAVGRSGLVDPRLVPPPSVVLVAGARVLGERTFAADVVSTVAAWVIAVVAATVVGWVLGLLLGSLPTLRTAATIVAEFFRPLPAVALIPLVIALIGADAQAKTTVAAFAAVWPVLFTTLHALGEVEPGLTDVTRSYRVPRWRSFVWVTVPATLPAVLTGVRVATSVALITVVSTEFGSAGAAGLGRFIHVEGGRMDLVLAGTVVAGLLGLLANLLFSAVRVQLLPWAEKGARIDAGRGQ